VFPRAVWKFLSDHDDFSWFCSLIRRLAFNNCAILSHAFSKRLENLKAAIALHIAFYNFCRVHTTLRVTPAMQAGVATIVRGVADLLL